MSGRSTPQGSDHSIHQATPAEMQHQITQLTETLNRLMNQPPPQPTFVQVPEPAAIPRVKEPKVPQPNKFGGNKKDLKNFLSQVGNLFTLQPQTFQHQQTRILFVSTLLEGHALTWFRTLQEDSSQTAVLQDWTQFIDKMEETFGDPFECIHAQRDLAKLHQGTGTCSSYSTEFRRIAQLTDFNESTQIYMYTRGLNLTIQNALAINDKVYPTLTTLITYCIMVDNRLYEAKIGSAIANHQVPRGYPRRPSGQPFRREGSHVPSGPNPSFQHPHFQPPTDEAVPMVIGAMGFKKLTDAQKQHRFDNNLCMYCGKVGHQAVSCPQKSTRTTPGGYQARGIAENPPSVVAAGNVNSPAQGKDEVYF